MFGEDVGLPPLESDLPDPITSPYAIWVRDVLEVPYGMVERFNRTLLMMLAMFAGENRDDWDDLLPAVMMAYRSSVHESTGFGPYRLMFGEDVGLPWRESDLPDPITSPYAIWVRDALEVAYNQVRRHSGQAVRRLFAVGDWVLRYYTPAKKCKLDSAWVGPYLIVALAGWALGIQRHPVYPIVLVHCQDLKKAPQPSGVVSWLEAPWPTGAPMVPMLVASTMGRTSQESPSIDVLPPEEGAVLADVVSVGSVGSLSGSRVDCPNTISLDVTSAPRSSAVIPFSQSVLRVDVSCILHPFFAHKMDSDSVRLMTIAHAFNYHVAVLSDGVKSAIRVGRSRKAEGRLLTEPNISWGQQVDVMFQILSTLALEVPVFSQFMRELQGESPNVQLCSEPWGHVDHSNDNCVCLSSDRTASYVHGLSLMPQCDVPISENDDASVHTEESGARIDRAYCLGVGRPGSVPFASHMPGAYGRLLLAVYGLLVSSDSLRPATWGGWRVGFPDTVRGSVEIS